MHFKETNKYFSQCESSEREVKKDYLKKYEKTEKFFKKRDNDIYLMLKPNQNTAIENSKKLGEFDINNPKRGISEMYKVLEMLSIK